MIETSILLQRIKECAHDDTLYLLEKLAYCGGFFVLNGNLLFMVPDTNTCSSQNIKTEYLRLQTGTYISAFNVSVPSFENGYYNFIELFLAEKDGCVENLSAFVNLCASYSDNSDKIDFISFFDSLVTLFQLPQEQHFKNLVGLFGELSVINYFFRNFKEDLSKYWHTEGTRSKLDFVSPHINIEVKTTPTEQFIFQIKHDQIFSNTKETYLAAVSISEDNTGETLNELVAKMLESPDYCNGFNFAINLEAERRRVSPNDAINKRFVLKGIKLYKVDNICPFYKVPETISDLSYKFDLAPFNYEDILIVVNKMFN